MFGKRKNIKDDDLETIKTATEGTPDLVVEQPAKENIGMPGFTADPVLASGPPAAPTEAPVPAITAKPQVAPAPAPVKQPEPVKEQYQIVETGMSVTDGIYVYKIVTNKYLGELGGVYEA